MAAKTLADNLASLLCAAASDQADLAQRSRRCNRSSYAAALLQRALPRLVLAIADLIATLTQIFALLGATTQCFTAQRSRPRPARHVRHHPSAAYKDKR